MTIKMMFNVSQLYPIPQFVRSSLEVNYNEQAFTTIKEEKEILHSSITFPARYYQKNINIFKEKLTNCLFLKYNVEKFIFSIKYRQRKVDLNTSEKSLVSITIRHRKFHIYVQLSYTKKTYLTGTYEK